MAEIDPQTEEAGQGRIRPLAPVWRWSSIGVRATHLVAASVILGTYLLGRGEASVKLYFALAALSGAVLLVYEFAAHPDLPRQLSGVATLLKLVLMMAAVVWPAYAVQAVLAAYVLAVFGARLPKKWRRRLLS